ncbi:MAG: O-antigen/teichoic acid export membrane protein [Oceanospirillaceae bacterium]|jgi:O-antigen/teichoic acid export membrane protein
MQISPGIKSILSNSAYTYVAVLLNQVLRIAYVFVLARLLGPELYGMLAYGNAWYLSLLSLSGLGLGAYLAVHVGKGGQGGKEAAELVMAARIIAVLLLAIFSMVFSWFDAENRNVYYIMLAFSFALIGRGALNWAVHMFQSHEKSAHILAMEKWFRPIELATGLIIAYLFHDVLFIACNHALFMLLQGGYSIYLFRTKIYKVQPKWDFLAISLMIKKVLPLAIASPLVQFMFFGPLILMKFYGASMASVANMAIAIQAFMIFNVLMLTLGTASIPVLSRNIDKNPNNITRFAYTVIRIAVLAGSSIAILGLTFFESIILILFQTGFEEAAANVGLLLICIVPSTFKTLLRPILISKQKNKSVLITDLMTISTLIVLMGWLLPQYGILGAIIAIFVSYSVAALSTLAFLYHLKIVKFRTHILYPNTIFTLVIITFFICSSMIGNFISGIVSLVALILLSVLMRLTTISEIKHHYSRALNWVKLRRSL